MPNTTKQQRTKIRENKAVRRRYLTWLRMMRYGVNNFTRNAWLTTAATAVMTITLLIVFTTIVSRNMLIDTVAELRQNINIPIFLRSDISQDDVEKLRAKLMSDQNIRQVTFVSSAQARKDYIAKNNIDSNDTEQLLTLAEADLPAKFDVNVIDPNDLSAIEKMLSDDQDFKDNLSQNITTKLPSERRDAISTISSWASTAEQAGLVATLVFVAISMLIIFNTIRMAIFNRREEIDMMKLIGADKNFIRGPFVAEAVMYGFIAALIATGLGYLAFITFQGNIARYGVVVKGVREELINYLPFVIIGMILLGTLIGSVSSRLAVRRYLKV
ncbi:MAG: permease-like cell division protein FtsX [Candidatus Saccharimonadales bacterium]